jgi:hypothetical protein
MPTRFASLEVSARAGGRGRGRGGQRDSNEVRFPTHLWVLQVFPYTSDSIMIQLPTRGELDDNIV